MDGNKADWDQRPASALFIKLIQFGAYLQDPNPLKGTPPLSDRLAGWLAG